MPEGSLEFNYVNYVLFKVPLCVIVIFIPITLEFIFLDLRISTATSFLNIDLDLFFVLVSWKFLTPLNHGKLFNHFHKELIILLKFIIATATLVLLCFCLLKGEQSGFGQ